MYGIVVNLVLWSRSLFLLIYGNYIYINQTILLFPSKYNKIVEVIPALFSVNVPKLLPFCCNIAIGLPILV